ncbi:uncharacterized protein LOC117163617 isoform X2 [Bombus vancouverensis nearcticus]|uniref:uncharacterized protein LOC117163617 isoform X2 n=1 Tax=Bombus vancouverensis nearcticus TaxID=2705178 RepID=UPI00213228EA
MAGKGFCVKIRLELHAITCPGVWLCPNGKIALRINSFGSTLESHRVSPIFPLLFHNEFNFKKTFTRLAALTDLQRILQQQSLHAELIQWLSPCNQPILLATFQTSLADLLYPVTYCKRLLPGVDVDLLMDPTKYFPQKSHAHRKRPVKGIIRQRKVCHSRTKTKAQVCHLTQCRNDPCNHVEYSCEGELARTDRCYHPMKYGSKCRNDIYLDTDTDTEFDVPSRHYRVSSVCGNLHIFDSCPVCFKYKCYFSNECDGRISPDNPAHPQKDRSISQQRISTGLRSTSRPSYGEKGKVALHGKR